MDILCRGKAINREEGRQYRTNYKNGDWVYGLVSEIIERYNKAEMTNEDGVSNIDVDIKTIGRFTGKKDINGNRIFEGDILLDREEQVVGCVYWDGDEAGFRICIEDTSYNGEVFEDLEIFGNIYDNPELVEELK